ncbi:protein-glutamate O-methyltransferase CheR [Marivivens donghaensis]|uniref:protein-glutamate O-methyltransferase n=1 Tax=Marivivens donghaensis TaxID=1699413 RepID=A0ABX0VZ35_9RHOB|nr:protein-glutamate O-methyltransferase CheR [Marivivens donghaensis]NIY72437.1 protein-glutamate O-methyltransferase CheR [Marivivens donghaensis]
MSVLTLSKHDFDVFCEYFYKKTGIEFDESKRYFVDKRLLKRIEETGAKSFRDYFISLRFESSQKEFQNIVNIMTVNETYFYRKEHQFKTLTSHVMSELARSDRNTDRLLRILSLPSSTGEETYSIALQLMENWPGLATYDVELEGADIDTDVLERAQEGIYSRRSVQYLPPDVLKRNFTTLSGGRYQISEDIREAVHLFRMNLSNRDDCRKLRSYDVIFCRNLLIYFDDKSRQLAINALFDALNPGGFLFLGHSESISRMTSLFQVRRFPESIVYQRPSS